MAAIRNWLKSLLYLPAKLTFVVYVIQMKAIDIYNKRVSGRKALVIFSGGQDSTTSLFWALKKYKEVTAISFLYGQRHAAEVEWASEICKELGVAQVTVDLTQQFQTINESALISANQNVDRLTERGLPASFVPNRNLIFLVYAHTYAQKIGYDTLITGVCETDYSGYPDCRAEFIASAKATMNLASEVTIEVETPIMWLNKAETFMLADLCGGVDVVISKTLTCYNGSLAKNDYGVGCGECNACKLRAAGFRAYLELKK